jgi:hypothetical protein
MAAGIALINLLATHFGNNLVCDETGAGAYWGWPRPLARRDAYPDPGFVAQFALSRNEMAAGIAPANGSVKRGFWRSCLTPVRSPPKTRAMISEARRPGL